MLVDEGLGYLVRLRNVNVWWVDFTAAPLSPIRLINSVGKEAST